jgi:tetratricopeptide (TPR) repeat protein
MKWAMRVAIVVALIAQGVAAIVATRYSLAYSDGVEAYRAYRKLEAWEAFDRALKLRGAHCDIWTWAGDAALDLGEDAFWANDQALAREALDRAWRDYAAAVLRCPGDSWSWSGLAAVSMFRSRSRDRTTGLDLDVLWGRSTGVLSADRAIALVAGQIAVNHDPNGYVELDVLGEVHEANGDFESARELFVESARRMPAPSFHTWGDGRVLAPRLYAAILEGLEAGLDSAPEGERSLLCYHIGKFALAQKDRATAERFLDRSLELASTPYETFQASWELSSLLIEANRPAEAKEVLIRTRRTGYGEYQVKRRLGQVCLSLGESELGCSELRGALRGSPDDTGLRLEASRACEAADQIDLAVRLLRDGFVLPTDDPAVARALLQLYERAGRKYTAALLARRWADANPERSDFKAWATEFDTGEF